MSNEIPRQTPSSAEPAEILVGIDGTSASEAAVRHAIALAREQRCRVRLVHVVPQVTTSAGSPGAEDLLDRGRELLAHAVEQARATGPGIDVRKTLVVGQRIPELAQASRQAALVVLGRREHKHLGRIATGATAAALASQTTCPVRVVPSGWTSDPTAKDVVVGIKEAATAGPLIERGLELAHEYGGTLVLVHTWQLPSAYADVFSRDDLADWNAQAAVELAAAAKPAHRRFPEVRLQFVVSPGRPAEVLAERSAAAAVVLVGRHGRNRVFPHLGHVPRAVVQSGAAAVEVGPAERAPAFDLELERAGTLLK
ncbi:universal stress protein [Marmoricola sp. RAF53]|uniref:universal stress protein n=1 Tax=Marmoricola sp. RAF53 TaxID=3233059 RepID=UPI003F978F79